MIKNTFKKSLALGLLMTFLITGSVWAANEITEDNQTNSIVIGNSVDRPSSAGGGSGDGSTGTATNVVAMGRNIKYANGNENLVLLGKDIDANGKRLVYIGSNINKQISDEDIKDFINTHIKSYLAQNTTNNNEGTSTTTSTDSNQVAIGSLINITGKNSVAIGMGVTVEANNAVAIGAGSSATEDNTVSFGRNAIKANDGSVLVPEINRTLTHVASGKIALDSTDAINGSQLFKEQEDRKFADTVLTDNLNKEIDNRKFADTVLTDNLNREIDNRKFADTVLTDNLNREIDNRKFADTVLTDNLNREIDNRKFADTVLTDNLNREIDNRKFADTVLTDNLNREIDRSVAKDIEHDRKLQHIDADIYGTYISGSTYFNKDEDNQVLINENGIKVGKNSSVMDTNGVYAGGATFDQAKVAISATGELKGASGKFQVASDGNTTITGILDVTSTSGQFAVKDDYVATRVTRGTSNNATTAGSINTGGFIGERVKNSDGSEFTATGKNTDGIINVAYKKGISTDVIQTANGINVTTLSHPNPTLSSQTDRGTEITGTNISIEAPTAPTSNRIYLSDVGQVKNVDSELKANSNYIDSPTVVGAINAEADIRRAQFAKLGNKIEKVGAGAAALAAMHPLDFDPDDKLQFSAGVGNYGGETATALGAFYRPTEKVMFNIAGTMGNDENMMNAGITFALDGRNNVSNSRVAMAREIQDLRAQVAQLTNNQAQMMALLNKVLDGQADELLANVMFPDVPENHWAYEYLDNLQKRGIIKGYPDGSFGGDRSLTRYEYATMLCRVLDQGISVDTRLLDEFEAELGRIRIDRIKGKDDSANKIERVRVNSSSDRDDYGSQIINTSAPTTN